MINLDWTEGEPVGPLVQSVEREIGSRRKRLIAVAFCERVAHLLPDDACREWVAVGRQYADGHVRRTELARIHDRAGRAYDKGCGKWKTLRQRATNSALRAVQWMTDPTARYYAYVVACNAAEAAWDFANADVANPVPVRERHYAQHPAECAAQLAILRDILGRPDDLPVAHLREWLGWQGGLVAKLARATYDDRTFEQMPILADALEDAGCVDEAILSHCRRPGPHWRGCWVLDALLSKG